MNIYLHLEKENTSSDWESKKSVRPLIRLVPQIPMTAEEMLLGSVSPKNLWDLASQSLLYFSDFCLLIHWEISPSKIIDCQTLLLAVMSVKNKLACLEHLSCCDTETQPQCPSHRWPFRWAFLGTAFHIHPDSVSLKETGPWSHCTFQMGCWRLWQPHLALNLLKLCFT